MVGCTREPARKGIDSAEAEYIRAEVEYFRTALSGKYSQNDITIHYKGLRISDYLDYYLESMLLYAEPINIRKPSGSDQIKNNTKTIYVDPDSLLFLIDALNDNQASNENHTSNGKHAFKGNNGNSFCYRLIELRNVMLSEDDQTPPEKLIELVTNRSVKVTDNVYKNKNAPLVAKYMYAIRYAIEWEYNERKLPIPGFVTKPEKDAWELLTDNKEERVRLWVARQEFAPPQLLSKLSNDSSDEILTWVFLNNNSSQNVKMKIAEHFSSNIGGLIEKYSTYGNNYIKRAVAKSNDASINILNKLSKDEGFEVRSAVASNPNTTAELLEVISRDKTFSVSLAVANNPKTPLSVLNGFIVHDSPAEIRKAAEVNLGKLSNTPNKADTPALKPGR